MTHGTRRKTTTLLGVIFVIFGAITTFASYNLILHLSEGLDLCTSTLACPGTLSGSSVYSDLYTSLTWAAVTAALGLGTAIGGSILAYNTLREKE